MRRCGRSSSSSSRGWCRGWGWGWGWGSGWGRGGGRGRGRGWGWDWGRRGCSLGGEGSSSLGRGARPDFLWWLCDHGGGDGGFPDRAGWRRDRFDGWRNRWLRRVSSGGFSWRWCGGGGGRGSGSSSGRDEWLCRGSGLGHGLGGVQSLQIELGGLGIGTCEPLFSGQGEFARCCWRIDVGLVGFSLQRGGIRPTLNVKRGWGGSYPARNNKRDGLNVAVIDSLEPPHHFVLVYLQHACIRSNTGHRRAEGRTATPRLGRKATPRWGSLLLYSDRKIKSLFSYSK